MSADIIQFPERKFTPPPKGYCSTCGVECEWPTTHAWPDTCPNGCAPFIVTSWLPNPPSSWDTWSPSLTN